MLALLMHADMTSADAPGRSSHCAAEHSLDTYWFLVQPCPLLGMHDTHLLVSRVAWPVHWLTRTKEGLHAVALHVRHLVVSSVVLPCAVLFVIYDRDAFVGRVR